MMAQVGCGRLRLGLLVAVLAGLSLALASRAEAYVYWTTTPAAGGELGVPCGSPIGRANLDGSGVNARFIGGANACFGMAVNGRYIYWTTGGTPGSIGRANLDGTDVRQHFITGAGGVGAIAVDGERIYWANPAAHTIGRANLDGSGVDENFIRVPDLPNALAVDGTHVYWVNWHGGPSTIGRANLDGSGVEQNFITGALGTSGLAVDSAHVYWTNNAVHTIGRANLNGSDVNQRFIASGLTSGVAVDDKFVYWTNPDSRTIARANLDGSRVHQSFINTGSVYALAVDAGGPPASITARLRCVPARVIAGQTSACTATVTDVTATPSTPTGTVNLTGGAGTFTPSSCTLSGGGASASCTVRYKTAATARGAHTITARYGGDRTHAAITASTMIISVASRPVLTNVSQSARRWRLGNALPHYTRATPPVGTIFRFTLDMRAPVKFAFTQAAGGRRVGGKCVAVTKNNSGKPHCLRTGVVAALRHQGKIGKNSLHFEGRINRHTWLAPGSYTLKITATANGKQSKPAFLRFTILR